MLTYNLAPKERESELTGCCWCLVVLVGRGDGRKLRLKFIWKSIKTISSFLVTNSTKQYVKNLIWLFFYGHLLSCFSLFVINSNIIKVSRYRTYRPTLFILIYTTGLFGKKTHITIISNYFKLFINILVFILFIKLLLNKLGWKFASLISTCSVRFYFIYGVQNVK